MLIYNLFTIVFILVFSGYGIRQLWRRLRYVRPQERGIDPIAEAEIFLAYGKSNEAIRVLKDSLKESPNTIELQILLLRAYALQNNKKAYCALAQSIHKRVKNQPIWGTIQENGRQLAPNNPLFNKLRCSNVM